MHTTLNKRLKQKLIASLTLFSALFTFILPIPAAIASNYADVTSHTVYADSKGNFDIQYCLNTEAYVTVGIYRATGTNTSDNVSVLDNYAYKNSGCYTSSWNRGDMSLNQLFYGITTVATGSNSGSDYVSNWLPLSSDSGNYSNNNSNNNYSNNNSNSDYGKSKNLKFLDFEVESRTFNPEDGQKGRITFVTTTDSYITFEIFDENDENEIIKTVVDNEFYSAGQYTVKWDGTNYYGDTVDQGEYKFRIRAKYGDQKVTETGYFTVQEGIYTDSNSTEDPRLKDVYATKESFDPGRNETTSIVFTLTSESDVTITIQDKYGDNISTIYDKSNRSKGTYAAQWNGAEVMEREGSYTYKIVAKNSSGKDTKTGSIEIADDLKDQKKPNITKDKVDEIPFKPKFNDLHFSFSIDRDADVTIEIRDGQNVIATAIDEKSVNEGHETLGWDGRDDNGDYVANGVYQYKIIAENYSGKDVEVGNFSVEETSSAKRLYDDCGSFDDVDANYKYCDAIAWAQNEGIFSGYNDGNFRPNSAINRVEALKVILEAMDVNLLDAYGQHLGFSDTNPNTWYAPYLKTATSLGIVNGYNDGTFRPNATISRIESLKIILEAGRVKHDIIIPTNVYGQPYYDTPNTGSSKWYLSYAYFAKEFNLSDNEFYFYPQSNMTRGEMADMLYRYHMNVTQY